MNGVCLSRVDAKLVMGACCLYEERLILEDEYHKVATKSLKQNALAGSTINPTDSKIDPFFNRLLHIFPLEIYNGFIVVDSTRRDETGLDIW